VTPVDGFLDANDRIPEVCDSSVEIRDRLLDVRNVRLHAFDPVVDALDLAVDAIDALADSINLVGRGRHRLVDARDLLAQVVPVRVGGDDPVVDCSHLGLDGIDLLIEVVEDPRAVPSPSMNSASASAYASISATLDWRRSASDVDASGTPTSSSERRVSRSASSTPACADLRGERRGETFVRGRGGRCVHRFAALPGGVGIDLLRFGGLIRLAFFVGLDRRIFRLVDGWLARIRFVRVRPRCVR